MARSKEPSKKRQAHTRRLAGSAQRSGPHMCEEQHGARKQLVAQHRKGEHVHLLVVRLVVVHLRGLRENGLFHQKLQ